MKFAAVCLVVGLIVGCGPQKVIVELTPLQEYALATQVADRELNQLRALQDLSSGSPDDLEAIHKQEQTLEKTKTLLKRAADRLRKTL